MQRRDLFATACAGLLGFQAVRAAPRSGPSLHSLAQARGVAFGSMVEQDYLAASPDYAQAIVHDCSIVVPGVEAKWWGTEPQEGEFTFQKLDELNAFVKRNGLHLRCHNLMWGIWNPPWVAPALQAGRGVEVMARHISAVVGHLAGQVTAWDVLNEAADPRWPSGPEGLCRTAWWHALGPSYPEQAFHLAHDADPKALLFVNDDWLEYPQTAAKRAIYLRLIEGWLRKGVPVHGFGLEAHLRPEMDFDAKAYRRFLADLADLGLVIHVTELDVIDRDLPADLALRDRMVADTAARFLDVVLDEKAVKAVLVWGLADPYSDIDTSAEARRPDGLPSRGAPLDSSFKPKPFWNALANAFRHAPERTSA
jgi:endo-1,4-beta-xylanase